MKVAVREKLFVELDHLAGLACFLAESLELVLLTGDKNDLVRLDHSGHSVDQESTNLLLVIAMYIISYL